MYPEHCSLCLRSSLTKNWQKRTDRPYSFSCLPCIVVGHLRIQGSRSSCLLSERIRCRSRRRSDYAGTGHASSLHRPYRQCNYQAAGTGSGYCCTTWCCRCLLWRQSSRWWYIQEQTAWSCPHPDIAWSRTWCRLRRCLLTGYPLFSLRRRPAWCVLHLWIVCQ